MSAEQLLSQTRESTLKNLYIVLLRDLLSFQEERMDSGNPSYKFGENQQDVRDFLSDLTEFEKHITNLRKLWRPTPKHMHIFNAISNLRLKYNELRDFAIAIFRSKCGSTSNTLKCQTLICEVRRTIKTLETVTGAHW